jgi:hypothetical protein
MNTLRILLAGCCVTFALTGCGPKPDDATPKKPEVATPKKDATVYKGGAVCGGIAGIKCPGGQTCVDDPSDTCDPKKGGADCPGICQAAYGQDKPASCGGIAAIKCPGGQTCVDDPSDTCDPKKGGADCPGICQAMVGEAKK